MKAENLLHNLHLRTQKCSVGCPTLNHFLNGGVPCNSITELVAESGTGKTQLCLQLSLSAQLPPSHGGLSASSLYIHSEFPFPIRRLRQLSLSLRSTYPHLFTTTDPCDSVLVRGVYSADEFLQFIPTIELHILNSKFRLPVRVIVIDSIAALFRSDFDNTASDLKRRSSLFFKISGALKSLAKRHGLAVVVTNQVVDVIGGECQGITGMRIGNLSELYSSGRRIIPALGLAWANCVNSRLFLSRDQVVNGNGEVYQRRRLSVVFAPHLPASSCEIVIKGEGVFGLEMQQA